MKLQTLINVVRRSQTNSHRTFTSTVHNYQKAAEIPVTAHTYGTCGIPKWVPKNEMAEVLKKAKIQLPSHLIRPPCMPGGKRGESQTCVTGDTEGGLYCIPCRTKYKYASFSDNINFTPPKNSNQCWWQGKSPCHLDDDDSVLSSLTRQCVENLSSAT